MVPAAVLMPEGEGVDVLAQTGVGAGIEEIWPYLAIAGGVLLLCLCCCCWFFLCWKRCRRREDDDERWPKVDEAGKSATPLRRINTTGPVFDHLHGATEAVNPHHPRSGIDRSGLTYQRYVPRMSRDYNSNGSVGADGKWNTYNANYASTASIQDSMRSEWQASGRLNDWRPALHHLTASGGLPDAPDMPEDIIRGSISYRDPMEELSNPLPPGWVEVEDDAGRIYFFHERSGETTWNRPRDRFVSTPL